METPPKLIGKSLSVLSIEEDIQCAARSDAKVLITGESGVGKEVVARLIHSQSRRREAPLITVNCAGVPDTLLASELFGHVRGSFTDAHRDRRGWIEQANRGTIFMDEVGEMSPQMQSLLLRFLDNGEIQQVGSSTRPAKVDVRVIAATNRSLVDRVRTNDFREDLYYRLNVIHIDIPPLRDRRDDIPALLDHFLVDQARVNSGAIPEISAEAMAVLTAFDWPGNVRQLKNVAERLVVRTRHGKPVTAMDLPPEILASWAPSRRSAAAQQARPRSDLMFERLVERGEDFWGVVYEPLMDRDVTRDDVRTLVAHGVALTGGGVSELASLFNVDSKDSRRFSNFLKKYQCHPDQTPRPSATFATEGQGVVSGKVSGE